MIILNCGKEKTLCYRKQVSKVASRIGLRNDIEICHVSLYEKRVGVGRSRFFKAFRSFGIFS